MNDQDLERELRSQPGPREDGYVPTRLPMTLEEGSAPRTNRSTLPRAALVAAAALAGALAVAVATGILSAPDNGVGSTNSSSPSAEASAASPGTCRPEDIVLSAEPWGGAAGSRGTVVTVALAGAGLPCNLPRAAVAEVVDANGYHLVKGATRTNEGSVALGPDTSFEIGVAWSNWCGGEPAPPMTLFVGFGDQVPSPAGATGSMSATAVPPCNGDGPSTLSLTDLQRQP